MTFADRPNLRLLAAGMAFLTYALAILWLPHVQKSTWRLEQVGGMIFAASYLFYDKPFGSVDRGLWDLIRENVELKDDSQELPADSWLARAAKKELPSGTLIATTLDGSGMGYGLFATAALFLFGPHTFSLVLGFVLFIGLSVFAFLWRFQDNRVLAVPILFLALTLSLLTPQATAQLWIDQSPIGGYRFFVIGGILPALHIIFELFDSTDDARKPSIYALLALQLLLLLCVTWIRFSAMYFVAAVAFAAIVAVWLQRHNVASRKTLMAKIAVLLTAALAAHIGGKLLTPTAYEAAGVISDPPWHRAFVGLSFHPDWPFGNLAETFDCSRQFPEGLRKIRKGTDVNSICAYFAQVNKGAEPGPLFGRQYEKLVRQAYWQVVREYPRQVIETYVIYKPLMVWRTLLASTQLSISRQTSPILIALFVATIMLLVMLRFAEQTHWWRRIFGAFAIIASFSLAPQLVAWSNLATSTDVVCYTYALLILIAAAAVSVGFKWSRPPVDPSAESKQESRALNRGVDTPP